MTVIDPIYLDTIIRANKLGAKGIQVIEATMLYRATDDYIITLTVVRPRPTPATEKEWFDE